MPQRLPEVCLRQTACKEVHIVDQRVTGRFSREVGVDGSRMDRDRILYDRNDRCNSGESQYDAEQEKDDVLRF